jgi:hypothetical protein
MVTLTPEDRMVLTAIAESLAQCESDTDRLILARMLRRINESKGH